MEKKRNMEIWKFFLHKSPSKGWFRNRFHSLLRRADVRGRADFIYGIWRISPFCQSDIVIGVKKVGHAENI